jgi:hypothetical protein
MVKPRLKILHLLGQRPDSTGSGIYLQSMMREAAKCGHDNFMIAGIQPESKPELHGISLDQCRFVRFDGGDIPFKIPGMTDIMPYPSTRFVDLSPDEIDTYEAAFKQALIETAARFVRSLAQLLRSRMAAALQHPQIDLSMIEDKLAAFTWQGIFARVERVYYGVLADKKNKNRVQ